MLEVLMEGKHLAMTCTFTVNNEEIPTHALIDCGTPGIAFMDQYFPCRHQKHLQGLKEKKQVEVIDGRPFESGDITHIGKVGLKIQGHGEQLSMFITKLGHYHILLGIAWLRIHHVAVLFASNTVIFGSQSCMTCCHDASVTVQGVTKEPPQPLYGKEEGISEPQI